MNIRQATTLFGVATLVCMVLVLVTHQAFLGWLMLGFGFAFAVTGLVYRAETRTPQRHLPK